MKIARSLTRKAKTLLDVAAKSLETIGWTLAAVEIDVDAETARIELRKGGLEVVFDSRNGKASITRGFFRTVPEAVGRRGDRFIANTIQYVFVGRAKGLGFRSGLRYLSHYVADNATAKISHEQARNIFRPLLAQND